MQLITLTTDFGTRDWFVGTMKGVIVGINPRATVVDVTHEIPAGDIKAGAFALVAACRFFPQGTVHVAVVDPGVGTARKALAVQTEKHFYVGPDNGLLSWALRGERIKAIRALENEDYFLPEVSGTFHGRDIFAPVAAHLSRRVPMQKLGPALKEIVRLPWPEPRQTRPGVQGEIIYLDAFGNAITNIAAAGLPGGARGPHRAAGCARPCLRREEDPAPHLRVFRGRRFLCPVASSYQAVLPGEPVAVIGSSGFLEIAVNGGSAVRRFGLRIGNTVMVRWR